MRQIQLDPLPQRPRVEKRTLKELEFGIRRMPRIARVDPGGEQHLVCKVDRELAGARELHHRGTELATGGVRDETEGSGAETVVRAVLGDVLDDGEALFILDGELSVRGESVLREDEGAAGEESQLATDAVKSVHTENEGVSPSLLCFCLELFFLDLRFKPFMISSED